MIIVGLTGSIGMGKSTAAARFRHHGIAVFDADAEVHRLYAGPLAAEIEAAFPGSTNNGQVDRTRLAQILIAAPQRFKDLEAIVHPRVRAGQRAFLKCEAEKHAAISVLEIPLLLETGAEKSVDVTVVVSAGDAIQRERVLARDGMTAEKFETIAARQLRDAEKRARADFVVETSGSIEACNAQIDALLPRIARAEPRAHTRFWS